MEVAIKDGIVEMDFEKVTEMLSNAFWCPGIKIDEVKKGALNYKIKPHAMRGRTEKEVPIRMIKQPSFPRPKCSGWYWRRCYS